VYAGSVWTRDEGTSRRRCSPNDPFEIVGPLARRLARILRLRLQKLEGSHHAELVHGRLIETYLLLNDDDTVNIFQALGDEANGPTLRCSLDFLNLLIQIFESSTNRTCGGFRLDIELEDH